ARFRADHGLSAQDATDLNASPQVAAYFEEVAGESGDAKAAADWVRNQPSAVGLIPAAGLAALIRLIATGTITSTIARQDLYPQLERDPSADPGELVEQQGLAAIGDADELGQMVDQVIAQIPAFVEQFRGGKDGVINALVGQVMKQTRGRADARRVQELLRERLTV